MHRETFDGKEYLVADTLEEAFVSWFGEDAGKNLAKSLPVSKPREKKRVCVRNG